MENNLIKRFRNFLRMRKVRPPRWVQVETDEKGEKHIYQNSGGYTELKFDSTKYEVFPIKPTEEGKTK